MKRTKKGEKSTSLVKSEAGSMVVVGGGNEFDQLTQDALEFSKQHSFLKTGKITPGDEVQRQIDLFASNERLRYDDELRHANKYRNQTLYLKDFIQLAIREEEYVPLFDIAQKTTVITKSRATVEKQFAGIAGQYAVSKLLTGDDSAFWQNEREIENRPNRYDCGMDIPGRKIDVKSTHLGDKIQDYSILDMHLAITPEYMDSKTTYIQAFVSILPINLLHANVYIAGWADMDMFPEPGDQWRVETFRNHRCLYTFQLNPFPSYWYVDKHDSFLTGRLEFKPWRDNVCLDGLRYMRQTEENYDLVEDPLVHLKEGDEELFDSHASNA